MAQVLGYFINNYGWRVSMRISSSFVIPIIVLSFFLKKKERAEGAPNIELKDFANQFK